MTERFHFHFSLARIGEGNGNPLQCSCLENPGDGGAWLAAIYGVAQSQTQLKRLNSSSMREKECEKEKSCAGNYASAYAFFQGAYASEDTQGGILRSY